MRVLISANGPQVQSGYGRPAKQLAYYLRDAGHEVFWYAWFGLVGGAIKSNGIVILPRIGAPLYGQDADEWARKVKADVVITIEDIWVLPLDFGKRLEAAGVKAWIPWFPVDGDPVPEPISNRALTATIPAVYSQFGERELCEAGVGNARYVPLGVDCEVYRPLDRQEVRAKHLIPDDAYVITMVAANKGYPCRKSFPEAIEAFGRFHQRHPEAALYLHTDKAGEGVGIDLGLLIDRLGIPREAVKFPDRMDNIMGLGDEHMAEIYNASDVLLAPSMGEGFGMPIIEAQACGCPVITQDCTSMSELTVNGMTTKPLQRFYSPLGQWQYIASVNEIERGLEEVYSCREWRVSGGGLTQQGIDHMRRHYDWQAIMERYWNPIMSELEGVHHETA